MFSLLKPSISLSIFYFALSRRASSSFIFSKLGMCPCLVPAQHLPAQLWLVMLALLREEPWVPVWSQKGWLSQESFVYLLTKWIKYAWLRASAPKKNCNKGLFARNLTGSLSPAKRGLGRPRKGEVSCCFLISHLCLRGGKSSITTEC